MTGDQKEADRIYRDMVNDEVEQRLAAQDGK